MPNGDKLLYQYIKIDVYLSTEGYKKLEDSVVKNSIINMIKKISLFMLDRNDMIPMKSNSFGASASYIQMIKNLVIEYKGYLPKTDKINKKLK